MKTFDDILRTELQKPVALKNGNGATNRKLGSDMAKRATITQKAVKKCK